MRVAEWPTARVVDTKTCDGDPARVRHHVRAKPVEVGASGSLRSVLGSKLATRARSRSGGEPSRAWRHPRTGVSGSRQIETASAS